MVDLSEFLGSVLPDLLEGVRVTLTLAAVALAIGAALGLVLGLVRVYGPRPLQRAAAVYTTLFRGTPLLVQLFFVYYGLPDIGITFSRFAAAFVTLGCNSAAYQAEYLRGALQAVGSGQLLAARAVGMSMRQAVLSIVLPQALRLMLPAWSNEVVSMIKYTAVVFLIALPDLMGKAKILSSRTFNPIPIYLTVAAVYLVLVGFTTLVLHAVERRVAIPGLTGDRDGP